MYLTNNVTLFEKYNVSKVSTIFVARNAKDVAITQLLCQRDDVIIEKFQLPVVPKFGRIGSATTVPVRYGDFFEESPIETLVDVPVLHGVTHVRRLHDVFNHYRGASIVRVGGWLFRKGAAPSTFTTT